MSTHNQSNGKKSANSSTVNTPASTPITNSNGNNPVVLQNSPPPNNNAPKYGTLVPNRIFVGGISANTTEGELLQLFSTYGTVKAAKIIQDRAGVSKGYGFITFESEDDAKRPLREADNIMLRERKLNIAPAIKKQPFNFNRAFDGSSPPAVTVGNPAAYYLPAGAVPFYQGTVGYYGPAPTTTAETTAPQPAVFQPAPVYPAQTAPPQASTYPSVMYPAQTIYMPQQYPMHLPSQYNCYSNNRSHPQYLPSRGSGSRSNSISHPSEQHQHNFNQPYITDHVCFNPLPVYTCSMDSHQHMVPFYPDTTENSLNRFSEEPYMGQVLSQDYIEVRYQRPDLTVDVNNEQHQIANSSVPYNSYNQQHFYQFTNATQEPDISGRQSNTPVVSLLSIDNTQEKDLNAMQGGRKKKIQPVQNRTNVNPQTSNGYTNQVNRCLNTGYYSSASQLTYRHNVSSQQNQPIICNNVPNAHNNRTFINHTHDSRQPKAQPNGHNIKKSVGRKYDRNTNNSNNSNVVPNVRTDSNSSAASAVLDENRNHEDKLRTSIRTPPPAPYSPLTNNGFPIKVNGAVNSNGRQVKNNYHNNSQNYTESNRRIGGKNRTNASVGMKNKPNNGKSEPTVTSTTDALNNNDVQLNSSQIRQQETVAGEDKQFKKKPQLVQNSENQNQLQQKKESCQSSQKQSVWVERQNVREYTSLTE